MRRTSLPDFPSPLLTQPSNTTNISLVGDQTNIQGAFLKIVCYIVAYYVLAYCSVEYSVVYRGVVYSGVTYSGVEYCAVPYCGV